MTTIPLRAGHTPHLMPAFSRAFSILALVVDVFAEAQDMARAAQKRYPFAEG